MIPSAQLLPPSEDGHDPHSDSARPTPESIASRIHETDRTDGELAALVKRRRACRAARDIVADRPDGGQRLVPLLADVAETELRRGDGSAVGALFFNGVSTAVQRAALNALADAARPALVRSYGRSDHALSSLIDTLTATLTGCEDHESGRASLLALSRLCQVRPAAVAETVPVTAVAASASAVARRLDSQWAVLEAARLLFVLATRSPEAFWRTNEVTEWTESLSAVDDSETVRLARAIRSTDPETGRPVISTAAVAELVERVCDSEGQRRLDAARQLGELGALLPAGRSPLAEDLRRRIRNTTSRDGSRAAVAAGEVLACALTGDDAVGERQRRRVRAATGDRRTREAAILGELCVAHPDAFAAVPTELAAAVAADSKARETSLAAVGEWIALSGGDTTPRAELCRRVLEGDADVESSGAIALGELAAHSPSRFAGIPAPLMAAVAEQEGDEREAAAFALGVAVTAVEMDDRDCLRDSRAWTGEYREQAARAFGELALAAPAESVGDVRVSDELPSDGGNRQRRGAVTALGFAVGADHDGRPASVLSDWATDAPAGEFGERVRHLGQWVAIVPGTVSEPLAPLVDRVRKADGGDRDRAARTLGHAVVTGTETPDDLGELLSRLSVADAVRRLSLDSLERTVETVGAVDGVRWFLDRPRYTGRNPELDARTAGEFAAAVADPPTDGFASLHREVRRSDGWHTVDTARALGVALAAATDTTAYPIGALVDRVRSTAEGRPTWASVLGETVAASPDVAAEPPQSLVDRVRATSGRNRLLASRALGEVVAATAVGTPARVAALRDRVTGAPVGARQHLARSLGAALAVSQCQEVDAPELLVTAVTEASGRDRRAAAWALGEAVVSGSVTAALDRIGPGEQDTSVFELDWRCRSTAALTRTEAVTPQELMDALDFDDDPESSPLERVLRLRDPMRRDLLRAFANAARDSDGPRTDLREPLVTALATRERLEPETRLAVVDALSPLGTTRTPPFK
ncbi:hypothetical protein [Haloarcula sediminis]|uniref:hypothetical protein n=1 Tax=Haloarcula sediminis TaxID=3111777 RepID=UPI002D77C22E|nr:hypothetical protein [Haloarcula sp. CK38]